MCEVKCGGMIGLWPALRKLGLRPGISRDAVHNKPENGRLRAGFRIIPFRRRLHSASQQPKNRGLLADTI